MERIAFSRLTAGSLFKIGYLALFGFMLPLFLLFGILALMGMDTVTVNGRYVHGVGGLVAAVVMAFLFPAFLAAFMALGGMLVRMLWGPGPSLELRPDAAASATRE